MNARDWIALGALVAIGVGAGLAKAYSVGKRDAWREHVRERDEEQLRERLHRLERRERRSKKPREVSP